MINLMETETEITIGKMVANNFRAAEIFRKYGIDFCCKGNRLLSTVCNDKNLDYDSIVQELDHHIANKSVKSENDYKSMTPDELVNHIETVHHSYVRESIPTLMAYLAKINKVHGDNHPELAEVYSLFEGCGNELTHHMFKEENILFPAIRQLASAEQNIKEKVTPFFFGNLENPISMMEQEHSAEGERFFKIADLTNNFNPPDDACTTYRVAFLKLEEFQNDLFTHIHLENNILFPKAYALEQQLMS